jgi:hypothetical protein
MASLADTLPAELLRADRLDEVVAYLRKLNVPRRFKRRLLQDWAAAVGMKLSGDDYRRVEEY